MNKLLLRALGLSLTLAFADATQAITLDDLLADATPVKTLEKLQSEDPGNFTDLCTAIKDHSFYAKAEEIGMGPLKRNSLIRFCQGAKLEFGTFKKAVQGEKPAAAAREVVHLRHVDLSAGTTFEESEGRLEEAQKSLLANAALLGKKSEVAEKLRSANDEILKAKEFYDNLSAAVLVLREDLGRLNLKAFNLAAHADDTPDAFIEALESALPLEEGSFTRADLKQIHAASALLKQAQENLAKAREDLLAINRELLTLTE